MTVEEFTSRMISNLDGEKDAEIARLLSALEQIRIVCIDNAATTVRHDLALEFVGGIAARTIARVGQVRTP